MFHPPIQSYAPTAPLVTSTGARQHVQSVLTGPRYASGFGDAITKLYFDPKEELLWVGDDKGRVSSYLGNDLHVYTAFKCHEHAIVDILVIASKLITAGGSTLRIGSKQGFGSTVLDLDLGNILCLCRHTKSRSSHVLVGGTSPYIKVVDVNTATMIAKYEFPSVMGPAFMCTTSRMLCCSTQNGHVVLLDPKTFKLQTTLAQGSESIILDMDVSNSLLVTCGMSFSSRAQQMVPDKFLKVYDLRYSKATTPLHVTSGPAHIKFMPSVMLSAGSLLVTDIRNQFQMVDTGVGIAQDVTQVDVEVGFGISAVAVCETGDTIVIGDNTGTMHQFAKVDAGTFNKSSYVTELATNMKPIPPIHVDDLSAPLGDVPGFDPSPATRLLSNFGHQVSQVVMARPDPVIAPDVLQQLRYTAFIGYAPNTTNLKPNRIPYSRAALKLKNAKSMKGGSAVTPSYMRHRKPRRSEEDSSPMKRELDVGGVFSRIPKEYRRVEQKYSFLGVEDFNFGHYNRSNFCGLEIHIPNAYCNAMLQVFYFLGPVKKLAQQHSCDNEFCLVCELGFLFHNMDQVPGTNCQATNFLRAFRTVPQAVGLDLILNDDEADIAPTRMQAILQSWNRFMLAQVEYITRPDINTRFQQMNMRGYPHIQNQYHQQQQPQQHHQHGGGNHRGNRGHQQQQPPPPPPPPPFLGTQVSLSSRCTLCQDFSERADSVLVFELEIGSDTMPHLPEYGFKELLKDSLCKEQHAKAWCKRCQKYMTTQHQRRLVELPQILALNCNSNKEKQRDFWDQKMKHVTSRRERTTSEGSNTSVEEIDPTAPKAWLPHLIKLKIDASTGELDIEEELDLANETTTLDEDAESFVYELTASVCHIRDPRTSGNFVAHIKVGEIYNKLKEGITTTTWCLFNDFAVSPSSPDDAVHYDMEWKVPIILYYVRVNTNDRYGVSTKIAQPMNTFEQRLLSDRSIPSLQPRFQQVPIMREHVPGEGDIVALDAEFVSIAKEEAEIRSGNHNKSTLKPAQMACARISAVYGSGPLKGQVLFDDYIKASEPVVDYLTQYSGVKPGDLDPGISTKHLTTLKNCYSKLRYLENRGVKFCGHGLSKDFRVINISPPKTQVIDTVDIYNIPNARKISLKFLAWNVLGINMQQSSLGHDSVEDSRTALLLYDKYLEVNQTPNDGKWNTLLQTIYEDGAKLGWKVPGMAQPKMLH
eukprot:m.130004 g.130004  ORF g.130004 m.130004 type:complete len:1203 (-) comp29449_c0_seq2:380-3988(-)